MATYIVSRHKGAIEWARRRNREAEHLTHLELPDRIRPGDEVIGPLPIGLIADIIARGARYFSIDMFLPEGVRGTELTADEMVRCGARLVQYRAERLNKSD